MSHLPWGALEWDKDPPPAEWDHALAALSGHPLQSCLWGDARRAVDGIAQHRWLARRDGEPIWMIRVEERKVLGGKIAWAPRGPTGRTADMSLSVPPGFDERLRAEGFSLLICDPWVADRETARAATSRPPARNRKRFGSTFRRAKTPYSATCINTCATACGARRKSASALRRHAIRNG